MTRPTLFQVACACTGTYENFPATFEGVHGDAHLFMSEINERLRFDHEGTQSFWEWVDDFDAFPCFAHPEWGPVHKGLYDTSQEVAYPLFNYLVGNNIADYDIGGHSKGGGETPLTAAQLVALGRPPRYLDLLEPPMVGTIKLLNYLVAAGVQIRTTQTRNAAGPDPVTLARPPFPGFIHMSDLTSLSVPDSYDIARKHRIAAIIEACARQGI